MIPHSALNSLKQPNKMQSKAYFPSTPFAFYFKEISTCDVEIVLCHVKQWGMWGGKENQYNSQFLEREQKLHFLKDCYNKEGVKPP